MKPVAILLSISLSMLSISTMLSCQSTSKKSADVSQEISFAEFKKVLTPRGSIIPLPGGKESLILMVLPGDQYTKVYTLDHANKEFTLLFDAGRNISALLRDRAQQHYYILLDNNGDENYQIHKFDPEAKTITKIFGKDGHKATILDFSRDGEHIFIRSNHQKKNIYRVYDFSLKAAKATALTDGKLSFDDGVADQNGKYLVLSQALGNNEQTIYLLDIKSRALKKILAKAATRYEPSFFDSESEFLYLNSDEASDRMGCAKIALSNPTKLIWIKTDANKDLECHYKEKSDVTAVVATFDGRIQIDILTGVFGEPISVPFPERAIVSQLSVIPGTTRAVARILTSDSPGNYYEFDISPGADTQLTQISELNRSSIKDFAKSMDLYYDSYDGMKIHGIVYAKGDWVDKAVKRPAIVWPHGGPDGQELHIFHPFFQYWVQKGFVVFAPNFRGSTGYGKKFETLNDGDWGGGHIKDVVYGKRALANLPYVDEKNIFIVGASFGGFSTLSAITQYPKEFKGAVAMVAIANLFTFMKSIPPDPAWQGEFITEIGDPVKDKEFYKERSPFFSAAKIAIPLKIYQAENDVRTVKAEMDTFVAELKQHQVPVDYEILEKEGHSISRSENWEKVLQGTVDFLSKQL